MSDLPHDHLPNHVTITLVGGPADGKRVTLHAGDMSDEPCVIEFPAANPSLPPVRYRRSVKGGPFEFFGMAPLDRRLGVYQLTDGTGIPGRVTLTAGTLEHARFGVMPTIDVAFHKCGMDMGVVVRFVEPDGPAPRVQVERPFGMDTVSLLIEHVAGRRALPSAN